MNMVFETSAVFILSIGAILLSLGVLAWHIALEIRLRKLFRGQKADNLESLLSDIQKRLEGFTQKSADLDATLSMIKHRLQRGIRHVGLVRFNPYGDAGGDQSFAIAILDELHNGFVLSSLYGRDSHRMYAKPITHNQSPYPLSEEEEQAIVKALSENHA